MLIGLNYRNLVTTLGPHLLHPKPKTMKQTLTTAANAALRLTTASLFGAGLLVAQTTVKPAAETETTDSSAKTIKLEKFEVTGSNIKRVDIEGPSPIKVISRQEIDATGRTNLTDLLL
jgi:hypothetical protein